HSFVTCPFVSAAGLPFPSFLHISEAFLSPLPLSPRELCSQSWGCSAFPRTLRFLFSVVPALFSGVRFLFRGPQDLQEADKLPRRIPPRIPRPRRRRLSFPVHGFHWRTPDSRKSFCIFRISHRLRRLFPRLPGLSSCSWEHSSLCGYFLRRERLPGIPPQLFRPPGSFSFRHIPARARS